jgi:pyruvate formate lyase activating enzyme
MLKRKISSLTFIVSPVKRTYINLAGCNFDCKACFAVAKDRVGRDFTPKELLNFFIKTCELMWKGIADEVVLTGGEPTISPRYLLDLIRELKEIGVGKIELSTNGYLLEEDYLTKLKAGGIDLVKLDLKAYSEGVHRWYTGRGNDNILRAVRLLHKSGLNFLVRTIFIPNIVDIDEVERIAAFLSEVDENIPYRIYQFAPGEAGISTKPERGDMARALDVAKRNLRNAEALIDVNSYRSDWTSVEICADELLPVYYEIAKGSAEFMPSWKYRYKVFGMNQVLRRE